MARNLFVTLVLFLFLCSCKQLKESDIQFCYTHPKYGEVCVKMFGKKFMIERTDLKPEEKAEVIKWVEEQEKK